MKRDRPSVAPPSGPAYTAPTPPTTPFFMGAPSHAVYVGQCLGGPGAGGWPLGSRLQPDRSPLDAHMAPKVVNLSGCDLDDNELAVLEKGLTFIPQRYPRDDKKLMTDFEAYARRLGIQYIFRDKAPLPHDPFRQKLKRPFTSCSNVALEHYISETRRDLSSVRHGKKTDNLTLEEKKSLARLKLRKDIVVKKADKGNCVTVESRDEYVEAARRHHINGSCMLLSSL